jgi:pyruvate dehydrogenase E2 component (dihydrolipoamide acetyltransferase)
MAEIVSMPKLGFDMAEGTLVRWVLTEGEKVEKGAVLAEIETDKATVEVESNFSGVVLLHLVESGEVVPVNTPIAVIGEEGEEIDKGKLLAEGKQANATDEKSQLEQEARTLTTEKLIEQPVTESAHLPDGVRASPLARRMAEEKGIDIRNVPGSGLQGRITKEDIQSYSEIKATPRTIAPMTTPISVGEPRPDRYVSLSRLRAIIGRRMVESTNNVPHFYVTREYDMSALMALRSQVNRLLPEEQKTSVNDFIIKAVALTLLEFPNLNASLDVDGGAIIQYGRINIGVAVAVENGLLTVVCRDSDRKSIRQISSDLRLMVDRAREGKVRSEDIEGSTFSLSNLGMYGVDHFSAIINPPEAGILAVGAVREIPVVVDGQLIVGTRMKATLSVDHRVSDGAEGARFLQVLAKYLEEPLRLMIG